ncbi:MAG: LytTR family DNA-binding domain-containing protein [Candidatus Eisenbacteria bacterium]
MIIRPTALIADDEPLLRESLARLLAAAWPDLEVIAMARNGREALRLFEERRPDVCFLDVHMPGTNGVEVAQRIARRAEIVFVTAYDQYALKAFDTGALDYLLKPVDPIRLADTVARVRERLRDARPAPAAESILDQLVNRLRRADDGASLRWIQAQSGRELRMIAVDQVDYFRSDTKHTVVAWRDEGGRPSEALIRTSLKTLVEQLDPEQFAQVHRAVVVNLRSIRLVRRDDAETADIHLIGRTEVLPVSRKFLHLFRQM